MANTKGSGSRRTSQVTPDAPPSKTPYPQPSKQARVYETIANLNRGFEQVLDDVERLKGFGVFRGEFRGLFVKTCRLTLEEMRAWANFELTEDLSERAGEDWAEYSRLLLQLEKKFRDPNDVLIEAKRLTEELAKKASKKKQAPRQGSHD